MISMAAFDLIIDQICKGLLGFTSVQFQRELLVLNPLIILINIIVTKMMGCKMMQNWWKVIKSNKNGGKSNNTNRRACEQVSIVQVCVGGDNVTKCDTYQSDFVLKIWRNRWCDVTIVAGEVREYGLEQKN